MKASRILRPSAVRTGMFCKLGSSDANRPVTAVAWLNVVCTRPVRGLTICGSLSVYVDLSLVNAQCSSSSFGSGKSAASSVSTSSSVDGCPVAVLRSAGSFIFWNRISPSCRGEERLKGWPASSYARCSSSRALSPSSRLCAASSAASIITPSRSMRYRISRTGISIVV